MSLCVTTRPARNVVYFSRRTFAESKLSTRFEMRSTDRPTPAEVRAAQVKLGYHPTAYGEPRTTETCRLTEDVYVTTWECDHSC